MPPLPERVFAADALAYDMVYGKSTPFLRFARACGARTADGIGMLVEQAAESFYIWRGVRPETAPVIELLRRTAE
jgi:shikimate dehydrogenase